MIVADRPQWLLLTGPRTSPDAVRSLVESVLEEKGIDLAVLSENTERAFRAPDAVRAADYVLADLTEPSENIMFEMGYARAKGKRILPIFGRDRKRIPADLAGTLCLFYDPSETAEFQHYLRYFVADFLREEAQVSAR